MSTEIGGRRVLTGDGWVGPAVVVIDDGRVTAVEPSRGTVPDRSLVPGFVDLQVNGIGADDVGDASADWDRLDAALLAQGVTAWCPTLTSRPLEAYDDALARIAEAQRRGGTRPTILGAHLEGPFLDPAHARAHDPDDLAPVDAEWLATLPDVVRVMTLAPELEGAHAAIPHLTERGITVALGHTGADADTARAAADAGATLVTHVFNAMGPFHHRAPGLLGAALTDPRLVTSLIADTVHVAPEGLALTFAAKGPEGIALITDAVAHGGNGVEVTAGAPRRHDGTLAGSVLTMDRAIANLVRHAGATLEDAVVAASATPARVLDLSDRGHIAPGTRADLVALDAELRVTDVWIAGRPARP